MHKSVVLRSFVSAVLLAMGAVSPAAASDSERLREPTDATRIHVAADGSDHARGGATSPVRTLDRALALAGPRAAVIEVGEGRFAQVKDTRRRASRILFRAAAGASPTVALARLQGGNNLGFDGIDFGQVAVASGDDIVINDATIRGAVTITAQRGHPGSSRVVIRDSEISAPGELCVQIRSGSRDVRLEGNHIHHCKVGIVGPGGVERSQNIQIRSNLLEHFSGDGIQFGHWNDVVIDGNVIRDMNDTVGTFHNDGLQTIGDIARLRITNNEIAHSADQLVLLQDNFGPLDDVLVQNNLIHHAGAYAVQSYGTNTRFINNTVWYSRYGGLLLRPSRRGTVTPTDTVVVNNILYGYTEYGGARAAVRQSNVAWKCSAKGPGLACSIDPGYGANTENFDLPSSNPFSAAGWHPQGTPLELLGAARG